MPQRFDPDVPVIIEARVNENALRAEGNPNVPYSPAEIVEAACRAWEAGAASLHWHGRDPVSGAPDNDPAVYLEVIEGVRARTDMLIDPTLGYISQSRVEDRVKHLLAANRSPRTAVDLAPLDLGSLDVDLWDPVAKRFVTTDSVYVNSRGSVQAVLTILREHGLVPTAGCWNAGQLRTGRCFREMGLLPSPTFWGLFFSGERMPSGAPPTMPELLAMVAEVPGGDPWFVLCYHGDALPLATWSISLGGHVAIGLGDYPYARLGAPTNADVVGIVADFARKLGRAVATPADARAIIGLPPAVSTEARA